VTLPQYPSPEQYGRPGAPGPGEQPGSIPLRPMAVGEILGVAVTVLRRHLVPLGGAAIAVSALSSAVTLGTLAGTGSLETFADAGWLDDILAGGTTLPSGIVLATLLGLLVTTIGGPVIAGIATAYAGAQALGRDGRGAVTERLAGRWVLLAGVGVVVGVLVAAGLMLLVVPGVIAYLVLVLAAPALVMERGSISMSLRRSATLTRGHRGRIIGAVALTLIAGTLASAVVSAVAGSAVGQAGSVTALVVSQLVSVLLGGLASAWTGAVIAVLYIDVRIRGEHLDQALRLAAAAELNRPVPPVQPGF
jgi:hypothetical protein